MNRPLAFATTALLAVLSNTARAQDSVPQERTVFNRERFDFRPIGQRVGGFIFYADLDVQEVFDSNIYSTSSNTKDDEITYLLPSVDLNSDWNNHALNLHAEAADLRFANHGSEDVTNFNVGVNGRLDIDSSASIAAGTTYKQDHEARFSPNDLGGREPTETQDLSANFGLRKQLTNLSLAATATFDQLSYTDTVNLFGGLIRESLRDHNEYQASLQTAYSFAPGRQAYVVGTYFGRDYQTTRDIFGFDRSSTGYLVGLGAKYDLTGVTSIDALLGYRRQDYADARLKALAGPTGALSLVWNVTELTSVVGQVKRDIQETILPTSAGYFATQVNVGVQHELLRNLLLGVSIGYEQDAFSTIRRNDDTLLAGFSAKYLISHNIALAANYDYRDRQSNQNGADFSGHRIGLRVSVHL